MDSEVDFIKLYDVDECLSWIEKNQFSSIALQFPKSLVKYATSAVRYLQGNCKTQCQYYIMVSSMCCVDHLCPQHLNGCIEAIISFGNVCLAPIAIETVPVYYSFGRRCKLYKLHYRVTKANKVKSDSHFRVIISRFEQRV